MAGLFTFLGHVTTGNLTNISIDRSAFFVGDRLFTRFKCRNYSDCDIIKHAFFVNKVPSLAIARSTITGRIS